jgi:hypothetical protein
MRIENRPLNTSPLRDAAPQTASATDAAAAEAAASATAGYVPSAELTHLTALACQEPEVRADRVRTVAAQLAAGAYLTGDSALRTADAMAGAVD